MSLVFELLASGLTANPIVSSYHSGSPDGRRHRQNATLVAVDISAFVPVKDFVQTVDETLDVIKALPATDPSRELLIPGERGARTYAQRSAAGVPLGGKVWASLTEEAVKAGVPVPELP
jgi:LDH2 family malate/lactate/ureidoglycolate dehydrogenase